MTGGIYERLESGLVRNLARMQLGPEQVAQPADGPFVKHFQALAAELVAHSDHPTPSLPLSLSWRDLVAS